MGRGHTLQLPFQPRHYFDAGIVKLAIGLVAATEGDVVVSILAGTGIPILAHALFD